MKGKRKFIAMVLMVFASTLIIIKNPEIDPVALGVLFTGLMTAFGATNAAEHKYDTKEQK